MVKTISVPAYLLTDGQLDDLLKSALEVATELAGEQNTAELMPLIRAIQAERARRQPSSEPQEPDKE
jgi:hypothetical protein